MEASNPFLDSENHVQQLYCTRRSRGVYQHGLLTFTSRRFELMAGYFEGSTNYADLKKERGDYGTEVEPA